MNAMINWLRPLVGIFCTLTLLQLKAQVPCDNVPDECKNYGYSKGMHVDEFINFRVESVARVDFNRSILGNPSKESALIEFAKQNKINYLVLNGVSNLFYPGNSDFYLGYRDLLVSFISDAKMAITDLKIGVTFGSIDPNDFNGLVSNPVTKERIVQELKYDTIFPAWNVLSTLIGLTPEAEISINNDVFAMVKLREFNIDYKEKLGQALNQTGVDAIVTENEYWNKGDLSETQYTNQWKNFIMLLDGLKALKTDHKIDIIDIYHKEFPLNLNDESGQAISVQSQVEKITDPTIGSVDNILLTNYTRFPSDIMARTSNTTSLAALSQYNIGPQIGIVPFLNSTSGRYIDHNPKNPDDAQYEPMLGDRLSGGELSASNHYSVQEIQSLAYNKYFSPDYVVYRTNKIKFGGFHWFAYVESPFAIYNSNPDIDQLRNNPYSLTGYYLTDRLRDHFPSSYQYTLDVYGPQKSPFGTQSADYWPADGITESHQWIKSNFDFSGQAPVTGNVTDPSQLNVNQDGYYFIKGCKNRCKTISIPVKVEKINNNLYVGDYEGDPGNDDNNSVDLIYLSPYIYVNQDPTPNNNFVPPIDYKNRVYGNGGTNYVHVLVQNKIGAATSKGFEKLTLYYSAASTGQFWPKSWIRNKNGTVYAGDIINKKPIYIDPLPGGTMKDYVIEWKPEDLGLVGGVDDDSRHFCLLARIERSENPLKYGMTVEENESVAHNAWNNNAVAWKNVRVVKYPNGDLVGTPKRTPLAASSGWETSYLNTGNLSNSSKNIRLKFSMPTTSGQTYYSNGSVKINLGKDLFNRWKSAGSQGSGISISPYNVMIHTGNKNLEIIDQFVDSVITTISINSPNAWIGGIGMISDEEFQIVPGFKMNNNAVVGFPFTFTIEQYFEDNLASKVGGQAYIIEKEACVRPQISSVRIGESLTLTGSSTEKNPIIAYQWRKYGVNLSGENSPVLRTEGEGTYELVVTYSTGCSSTSNPYYFYHNENSSINQQGPTILDQELTAIIYPNPSESEISISVNDSESDSNGSVEIFDMLGRRMIFQEVELSKSKKLTFPTDSFVTGNYVVKIVSGEKVQSIVIKVVK